MAARTRSAVAQIEDGFGQVYPNPLVAVVNHGPAFHRTIKRRIGQAGAARYDLDKRRVGLGIPHGLKRMSPNMPRIEDLSDADFMKLQAEYGDSLPICPICMLEDVRHLLVELVTGDAVSVEVKNALAPVLYAVTGALVTDRTMAEQGNGTAHLGGDEDIDDDGSPPRTQ
jgi:hypothetical protein